MDAPGGIPELTAEDIAGAAQWLSRPRWLACMLKYALDTSNTNELEMILLTRFVNAAVRNRHQCSKPEWRPPKGIPFEGLYRRLCRLAINETVDVRRGFNLQRAGFTPAQFADLAGIYEIIHDDLNWLANDGARHISRKLACGDE